MSYLPPGSSELAGAVAERLRDPGVRLLQLRNHGQLVVGESPAQAVERAVFFELACRVYLLSGRRALRRFSRKELEILFTY